MYILFSYLAEAILSRY